jgi:hypothetical protein
MNAQRIRCGARSRYFESTLSVDAQRVAWAIFAVLHAGKRRAIDDRIEASAANHFHHGGSLGYVQV